MLRSRQFLTNLASTGQFRTAMKGARTALTSVPLVACRWSLTDGTPSFSQLRSPEVKRRFYFMGNYLEQFRASMEILSQFLAAA